MRRIVLLCIILFSTLYSVAQDAAGYYTFSKKTDAGLFVKLIAAPYKSLSYEKCTNMSSQFLPMNLGYISIKSKSEELINEKYIISFVVQSYGDISINKGGRLLIKYKDGETLTITTDKGAESEYDDGKYVVSPEYALTKDNITTILKKGVVKLRIETIFNNIDIEFKSENFMLYFNDFVNEIEKRKNNDKDSFDSDF